MSLEEEEEEEEEVKQHMKNMLPISISLFLQP
jgi:hypothetical protein